MFDHFSNDKFIDFYEQSVFIVYPPDMCKVLKEDDEFLDLLKELQ